MDNNIFEEVEIPMLPGETRGEYLERCIGISGKKKSVRRSSGHSKIVDEDTKARESKDVLYENARKKEWNFREEDFEIDENNFNFRHKTWKTWCLGGSSKEETMSLIRKYIESSKKPLGERDTPWLHLAKEE